MSAITASPPRPLLLAYAAGSVTAAIAYAALITPWLGLMVLEPDELDWLNSSNWLQHFGLMLRASLIAAIIFSPIAIPIAILIDRKWPRLLLPWFLMAVVAMVPFAFLGLVSNLGFDCAYNCEPSSFRNLIVIGSPFIAGVSGALVAWFVRYGSMRGAT